LTSRVIPLSPHNLTLLPFSLMEQQ
jgi:hypothetical protein